MTADFTSPHLRWNPLRGEWVLVSPQRNARPWQGQIERTAEPDVPEYDPSCYLCPGSRRAGGAVNPDYRSTFVFDNDFPALLPVTPDDETRSSTVSPPARLFQPPSSVLQPPSSVLHPPSSVLHPPSSVLLAARAEPGRCRVVCFSPRHDLTLSRMDGPAIRGVVDAWIDESRLIGGDPTINYVQIFENRGAAMGASNPHPHGQIWATATVPNEPAREQAALLAYRTTHATCLLCDYLSLERARGERLVLENDSFVVLVPYWAIWPFETTILARRHVGTIEDLTTAERDDLASVLKRLTTRYDNLFETPFPYSMGFHQRPCDGAAHEEWHLHLHFLPPLLRSATVRKFMVGFELLGTAQRDLTAEDAAARLRALSEEHYRDREPLSSSD